MLVLKGDAPLPVRAAAILRTALRIRDLGPGDFVSVECVCGHSMLIPPTGLLQGLRLPPFMPVLYSEFEQLLVFMETWTKSSTFGEP
jgi:hypothetical protein